MVLLAVGLILGRSVFGVTNVVENSNFTGINPGIFWTPSGSGISDILFPGGYVSMGNISGIPNETNTQFVYQTVTIPANTIFVQYSFDLQATTVGDAQGTAGFGAFILDSTGTTVLTNLGKIGNNNLSYTLQNYNLTNFAGLTVQVMFEAQVAGATNSGFDVTAVRMLAWSSNDIPTNDNFTNAIDLSGIIGDSIVVTNILATREPNEVEIEKNPGGHSLWWKWTAPASGTLILNTKGSLINTLLGVFTGDSVSSLTPVAADINGNNSSVKVRVSSGTTYYIDLDGKNGAIGTEQLNLTFTLDTTPPKVTITSPASGAKLTNSTVTVKGTASDNVAVKFVQYSLENADGTNDYQDADGTNTWTATIPNLIPGPNTILVRAYDTSSNVSAIVSRSVTFIVVSPLTLTNTGSGTISPNLDGQSLDVGADYKFTAKPGPGQVLSNWVADGVEIATTPTLTVTMQSNLMLVANFVPNPFIPFTGDYQGLFYDTNGPEHVSSGFYNLTLASLGSFSAKVMIAGKSYSYTGQFSAGGMASNNIVRKGLPSVSAQLQLDLSGGGISGVLSSSNLWISELNADRAMTNAAAEAGHYTLTIPGANDDSDSVVQPGGDSYGTAVVSANGGIAFAGALADDTKVSQKGLLLANGQWPFYVPLYSGNGSIFGWLTFSNQANSDITGTVDWFKLAQAAKFYSAVTNSTTATGSMYHFTNGVPVLNFTDGLVWFANGNIPNAFTNQVTLSNNVVSVVGTNKLSLKLTTSTGLFKVTAVDPDNGKTVTGSGVVLQKQNSGSGFFLGTNQVGHLFWGPAGP